MSFLSTLRPTQGVPDSVPTCAGPRGPFRGANPAFPLALALAAPFSALAAALLSGWSPLGPQILAASQQSLGAPAAVMGIPADPKTPMFLFLCGLFLAVALHVLFWRTFSKGLVVARAEAFRGRQKTRASIVDDYYNEDEESLEAKDTALFWQELFRRVAVLVPLVHVIGVAFGAPVVEDFWHTLGWAWILAVSFAVPGSFNSVCVRWSQLPPNKRDALSHVGEFLALAEDTASPEWQLSAWGTCLGSWVGALVIPLDWDRPWQRWPVSCAVMALVGHSFGSLVAGLVIFFRRRMKSRNIPRRPSNS